MFLFWSTVYSSQTGRVLCVGSRSVYIRGLLINARFCLNLLYLTTSLFPLWSIKNILRLFILNRQIKAMGGNKLVAHLVSVVHCGISGRNNSVITSDRQSLITWRCLQDQLFVCKQINFLSTPKLLQHSKRAIMSEQNIRKMYITNSKLLKLMFTLGSFFVFFCFIL